MNEVQIALLGGIATVIVFALKILADRVGWSPQRGWLTGFLFAVAVALAAAWQLPVFPGFPIYGEDVAVFAGALVTWLAGCLAAISPIVAFATLIYNTLGKMVFEKLAAKLGVKF